MQFLKSLIVSLLGVAFLTHSICAQEAERAQPSSGQIQGALKLSPQVQSRIGLTVATVKRGALSRGIETTGLIEAIPAFSLDVNAPVSGRLVKVLVTQGQSVLATQPLAVIDSPEIRQLAVQVVQQESQIRPNLIRAKAQVSLAMRAYERQKTLFAAGALAAQVVEQAGAALVTAQADLQAVQQQLSLVRTPLNARLSQLGAATSDGLITLKAPRAGFLAAQKVTSGGTVQAGQVLFSIVNLSQVWATADLYQENLAQVRLGQPVEVTTNALLGRTFMAKVSAIDPVVDLQAQKLRVHSVVDNPLGRLRPGMFTTIKLLSGAVTAVLVVPKSAVLDVEGRTLVYVKEGDNFESKLVELGSELGDEVSIHKGLKLGEQVVTRRVYQLYAQQLKGGATSFGEEENDKDREKEQRREQKVELNGSQKPDIAERLPAENSQSPVPTALWVLGAAALLGSGFAGGIWIARRQVQIARTDKEK